MSAAGLSRRGFLKLAGGGVAVAAIVPASVFGAAAPSNRVTLAAIGCGGRAQGVLKGFLGLADQCQIVATCDPFAYRREEMAALIDDYYTNRRGLKFAGCKPYNDFRDMLPRKDIDGVVIATPDHWHVPAAIAAARAGKDMYVEKPLGIAMKWNYALRDAVHRYGSIFHYGTQQRSSAHMRLGCELVRNGYIGELKAVDVWCPGSLAGGRAAPMPTPDGFDYDLWLGPAPATPYTRDRCCQSGVYHISDYALGFIAGWGAHPLDIAVWGMGDTTDAVPIEYEGSGVFPEAGLYDSACDWDVRGRYASGAEFRFRGRRGNLTTFIGTEGTVSLTRSRAPMVTPVSLQSVRVKPEEIHLPVSTNHCGAFVEGIRTRKQTLSNVDVAVLSDSMSHLSEIAIRTGRKIKWDPKGECIVGDDDAARRLDRSVREPYRL